MDSAQQQEDLPFKFSFVGRLSNLSLAPSPVNCLWPTFEAIKNSIQAIEEKFGEDQSNKGFVKITILDDPDGNVIGFEIDDNGVGLNEQHWSSFQEADTTGKIKKGGKGVGRLLWLKAFDHAEVVSNFKAANEHFERSFQFMSDNDRPIKKHTLKVVDGSKDSGTNVRLSPFRNEYLTKVPRKTDTLERLIIRHFLPYLVTDNSPSLTVARAGEEVSLKEKFAGKKQESQTEEIQANVDGFEFKLTIQHLLIDKDFRDDESGYNAILFYGDKRLVKRVLIDSAIGLEVLGGSSVYLSIVESPYLDSSLHQERTIFTIDDTIFDEIKKRALDAAKIFLQRFIDEVRIDQTKKIESLIKEYPRFINSVGDPKDFSLSKLSLNQQSTDEIYVELSRNSRRELERRKKEYKANVKNHGVKAMVDEKAKSYFKYVKAEAASMLADYMTRRKAILEVMRELLTYRDSDKETHYFEGALHTVICPLGSTTDDLDYSDHDLWIIDDRLAYYTYFNSDRKISKIVAQSDSGKEPDLTFFELGMGFLRKGTTQPVVIVEFKRPNRNDYTREKNPVFQIVDYVSKIRSGAAAIDKNGTKLSSLGNDTHFIGYVIADLTDTLRECLVGTKFRQLTSDGRGYFGYDETLRLFIEIIPFDKLLDEAETRHEKFFDDLGLK